MSAPDPKREENEMPTQEQDGRSLTTSDPQSAAPAAGTQEADEGTWERVAGSDLRLGDRARGKHHGDDEPWSEGVVDRVERDGIRFVGEHYLYSLAREWERFTPAATPEPDGAWVPTEADDFEVGDRVRVTHRRRGTVHVGRVRDVTSGGWLHVDCGEPVPEAFSSEYRTFEKWAPTPVTTGWVPVTDYATLNEGDVVRATPNHIGGRMQAVVIRSDRYSFNASTAHVIEVSINGRARDLEGFSSNGYEYGEEPGVLVWRGATPAPEPGDTTVPQETLDRPAFRAPQVGDTFTRTHTDSDLDDRRNCLATRVESPPGLCGAWRVTYRSPSRPLNGTIHVTPRGEITNTSGGRPGRYVLTEPAPIITERQVHAASASREVPIPGWATSLDAAKRHVHAEARRLYRRGDNCYSGSDDFVGGLDLPSVGEDYPAPVVVDETAEIREFLTKVREVALSVARDHGKSISLVEGWLNEQGIVEPPPAEVQHTVTFTAPADANVQRVLRDLGWRVRSNPFD